MCKTIKRGLLFLTVPLAATWRYNRFSPKHIVFDIDGTLIATEDHEEKKSKFRSIALMHNSPPCDSSVSILRTSKKGDLNYVHFDVWRRPKSRWALDILQRMGCTVSVYTAAHQFYADEMLDTLYPGLIPSHLRLYRRHCQGKGFGKNLLRSIYICDKNNEGHRHNRTAVFNHKFDNANLSLQVLEKIESKEYKDKLNEVILVDDKPYNNFAGQRIWHIPEYTLSNPNTMQKDREMVKIVGKVVLAKIFGLPSSSSPHFPLCSSIRRIMVMSH